MISLQSKGLSSLLTRNEHLYFLHVVSLRLWHSLAEETGPVRILLKPPDLHDGCELRCSLARGRVVFSSLRLSSLPCQSFPDGRSQPITSPVHLFPFCSWTQIPGSVCQSTGCAFGDQTLRLCWNRLSPRAARGTTGLVTQQAPRKDWAGTDPRA